MSRTVRFMAAFSAAMCLVVAINALPYWGSRGAYQYDGQELAGFPFAFHKVGGDCSPSVCDTYNFHAGFFVADVAIGLAFAMAIGLWAASSRKDRRCVG
jgi:hypothetical protein